MNIFHAITGIALITSSIVSSAHAADIAAGKKLADDSCQSCHGNKGIGIADMFPNLAGQKAAYLESALQAYRDGTRNNQIMNQMAKSLSAEDIANVAAYYASLNTP
jgi:cytochrome c553